MSSGVLDLDFIEELRMRRWARENYCLPEKRSTTWHPIVLDEMVKKDSESGRPLANYSWSNS